VILGDLAYHDVARRLVRDGLPIRTGPFIVRLWSPLPEVARAIHFLYAAHEYCPAAEFCDIHLRIDPAGMFWSRDRIEVTVNGVLWGDCPRTAAVGYLEWGQNYGIFTTAHSYLLLHAGVAERNGRCVILPGVSGAGKSTLSAALSLSGWRLFTDEIGLVSPETGLLLPLSRPAFLKGRSLSVIEDRFPAAQFGPRGMYPDEDLELAHLRPNRAHVQKMHEPAPPGWLVFPRYVPEAAADLKPLSRGEAFIRLARLGINYSVLAERGFDTLSRLIAACDCHEFTYSSLDDAVATFDALAEAKLSVAEAVS
jgi:HprK-related kinase A